MADFSAGIGAEGELVPKAREPRMDIEGRNRPMLAKMKLKEEARESRESTPILLEIGRAGLAGQVSELFESIRAIRGHFFCELRFWGKDEGRNIRAHPLSPSVGSSSHVLSD